MTITYLQAIPSPAKSDSAAHSVTDSSGKQGLVVMDAIQFAKMPPCLTPVEAAVKLKHCAKWVRQTIRRRQVPVFKIGRKILIPESHLKLFL